MTLLLDATVKVSLVIAAGLALAVVLRQRSAALRHAVVAAAILCALTLPALARVVPAWGWPLPEIAATRATPAALASGTEAPRDTGAAFEVADTVSVAAASQQRSTVPLLVGVWLTGAGLSALVLLTGLLRLAWLASRARRLESGPWVEIADGIASDLGVRRPVRLLESDQPSLLVTWGVWQPKVLLPIAARAWPRERAAIVLRHELAHIRRGDWLVQLAGEALRTVYWFNPLMWIACARLRQESEQACDDEVLTSGVQGTDYASHLVDLARQLKADAAPRVPAPAIARSSSLERRVRAMLDARLTRTPLSRVGRVVIAASLLTLTVGLAAAQKSPVVLSGSVIDEGGAPVPGAAVVLTNSRTQAKFEVKTSDFGKYEFVPLPPDEYALSVSLPGFKKNEATVALVGKATSHLTILTLGELQETISIRSGPSTPAQPSGRPAPEYSRAGFLNDMKNCTASPSGGRVRPPRKIKDVKPVYPDTARDAGTTGTVLLKATITTDGTVRDVQVVKSVSPELDASAVDAVRQWLFDGTLLNCNPVEVTMNVSITFGQ
jgi:TonB family protein